MSRLNIFISLLLLACCINANAQSNFKKIDDWLADNTKEMGGRSILMIYKNGQVVYTHAVNDMNFRQKMAVKYIAKKQGKTADLDDYTPSTRLPVASCSKWPSAALIMTFVDEGKIKLTDTVGKYLPALSKSGKGKITISECLSHLTGVDSPPLRESLDEMRSVSTMDEAIETIAKMPMEGEPGKVFHYGNTGLQIAAAVLEKVSGKSFQTLFAERIAKPLNMKHTDFGDAKVALPAGGIISTPEDYLNFLVMILNRGTFKNKRILSESSIAQMQINRVTAGVKIGYAPTEAANLGYGFGEWVMENKAVSSPGLFGSFPWVNNDKKYAAIMITFYLKNTGRRDRYEQLMKLADDATTGN
jgi:CubicO group peptidase (beta-lactamase class C family)